MRLTLGTTYYENPDNLLLFISNHIGYVDELIVVDDGSSLYPIENYMDQLQYPNLKVYKVTKDYGFNSHGCRNLIVKQSTNDWMILLDSDRAIINPKEFLENIKRKTLKTNVRYRFLAHTFKIGEGIHPSVNDYLIHRDHFLSVGGYDEELMGIRNGDRFFFYQLLNHGHEVTLRNCEIILLREASILSDNFIKSDNDTVERLNEVMYAISYRARIPNPKKSTLTFNWKQLK